MILDSDSEIKEKLKEHMMEFKVGDKVKISPKVFKDLKLDRPIGIIKNINGDIYDIEVEDLEIETRIIYLGINDIHQLSTYFCMLCSEPIKDICLTANNINHSLCNNCNNKNKGE